MEQTPTAFEQMQQIKTGKKYPYGFTMLSYGLPGIGKTVLMCSSIEVPEIQPTLFLSYESGTLSVRSKLNFIDNDAIYKPDFEPSIDKINTIIIRDWDELEKIHSYLRSDKNKFKSVLVDSLTEINYLCTKTVVEKYTSVTRYAKGVAILQDYGVSATYMRNVIRMFRDLADDKGFFIFMSCQLERDKDEKTGQVDVLPNMTGKLSIETESMFDVVGYMEAIPFKNDRKILFQPTNVYHAKDRTEGGKLGKEMINPTIKQILDLAYKEN